MNANWRGLQKQRKSVKLKTSDLVYLILSTKWQGLGFNRVDLNYVGPIFLSNGVIILAKPAVLTLSYLFHILSSLEALLPQDLIFLFLFTIVCVVCKFESSALSSHPFVSYCWERERVRERKRKKREKQEELDRRYLRSV